jgi:UDP-3-O-[3-hydroxymyristoyl] glucosamine N-acyltransferase
MYKKRMVEVHASEIAEILNLKLTGRDFIVRGPGSFHPIQNETVVYAEALGQELADALSRARDVLVIVGDGRGATAAGFSYIETPRPRLAFVRVLNEFFVEREVRHTDPTARISPGARLGRNVTVGSHSVIGPDVTLGDNIIVLNNVVITGHVTVGRNCVLKDNSTIGSEGYSFELDEAGLPIHFPYTGRIVIGDNVWIGSNTTIERSELDDTVIGSFVKIDDLVQIGQRCLIGERSMIAAGTIVSASVTIGKGCWLAPNVSVRDRVVIGDNVLVGIGAVVVKDLARDGVYVGNPARFLKARSEK